MRIAFTGSGDKYHHYYYALEFYHADFESVDENVNPLEFDGLLVPGGVDVNPKYYGQQINGSKQIDDALDQKELAVIDKFVKANKPILGICRGLQILNVYFGGTLIQDLDNKAIHTPDTQGDDKIHNINVEKENFLNELFGDRFLVSSYHHQAIDKLGENVEVIARADDGIIEACVVKDKPVYMVQFHPERMVDGTTVPGYQIFKYFLQKCK